MPEVTTDLFRSELVERRERLQRVVGTAPSDRRLMNLLSEVDAALQRIDDGNYGLCETCHDPIEQDRLFADPLVRFCLDHLSVSEQRALEQDLSLAAQIQRGLLPQPEVFASGWHVAYQFVPRGAVSGDYCDVVRGNGDGEAFFLIGDVSGKGVAAAILMGNLQAMFRTLLGSRQPIEGLLHRANRLFCETTIGSQYATLVCIRASANGEVEMSNAGHCPVLLHCGGETQVLQSSGLPLGMFCHAEYGVHRARLGRGDAMLLYTDGVVEARNADDDEYGQSRLLTAFNRSVADGSDARALVRDCLADVGSFRQGQPPDDDVTLMAIRRVE